MRQLFARSLVVYLASFASLPGATPLFHGSFEAPNTGWTIVRGTGTVDPAIAHEGKKSMRVESAGGRDAAIRSASIPLTIGKRYALTGWIRTDRLSVRDLDRTPVAVGAALSMASMPFDVHSAE